MGGVRVPPPDGQPGAELADVRRHRQSLPVGAVFAFPLYVAATGVGVLDCYRSHPGPLDPGVVREARELADTVAAELLRRVLAAGDPDRDAEPPRTGRTGGGNSPQDRQATGMVMAQLDLPVGAAYARLRGLAFASARTAAAAAVVADR